MTWITDRLPVKEDADIDGDVICDGGPGLGEYHVKWSAVESGQQWKHSDYEGIVEPVPLEKPESIQSNQLESWRGFLYITRTYVGNGFVLDAVATDGTAWHFIQNPGEHARWERTPDLPCE